MALHQTGKTNDCSFAAAGKVPESNSNNPMILFFCGLWDGGVEMLLWPATCKLVIKSLIKSLKAVLYTSSHLLLLVNYEPQGGAILINMTIFIIIVNICALKTGI